jgi:hypothetical protein
MRRFDKAKNIDKVNLLAEQRYLQSKGLLKENYNLEGLSNDDYVKHFLDNFYVGLHDMESDLDNLYVEFKLKYNDDDEDSRYWVDIDFDIDGSSIKVNRISFDIGWDEEKEEFLRTFNLKYNDSFKPVIDFINKEFISRYNKNLI